MRSKIRKYTVDMVGVFDGNYTVQLTDNVDLLRLYKTTWSKCSTKYRYDVFLGGQFKSWECEDITLQLRL